MNKTLYQASKEFQEAWHDFCLQLAYSLKLDKVVEVLARWLEKVR